jgi:hypothetical protein
VALLTALDGVTTQSAGGDNGITAPTDMVISSAGLTLHGKKRASAKVKSWEKPRHSKHHTRKYVRAEQDTEHVELEAAHQRSPAASGKEEDYWCPDPMAARGSWSADGQFQTESLTGVGRIGGVKMHGYCYYLGKEGESCTQTCMRQMGGTCNAAGTEFVGNDTDSCKFALQAFADSDSSGIGFTANVGTSPNDRSGCTWMDLPQGASRVEVFRKDDQYPLCSSTHASMMSHRLCACTVMFGDMSPYTQSNGMCRKTELVTVGDRSIVKVTGQQDIIKKAVLNSEKECEDECTRDKKCEAFAFVFPWDDHPRQCIFFGPDHVGDGMNSFIKCWKKERYLQTMGECRKRSGRKFDDIMQGVYNAVDECKVACDAHPLCEAFEAPSNFTAGSQCILFEANHTGNGVDANRRCFTRATGGVFA